MDLRPVIDLLGKSALFGSLPEVDRASIAARMRRASFSPIKSSSRAVMAAAKSISYCRDGSAYRFLLPMGVSCHSRTRAQVICSVK